ncbi:hypothetical protein MNEG_13750 [Monoraphidium neglectum]|uniref:Uncharacterized protein n=1 Tax=Monoraphidium neglectum TaxID=145388 RepID=A0A0D2LXK7_9CHLO|nr:hypothetical protein MNEG_13750 [Monoraphidium neglectum]KIY94211.1 hypothetical protein MNEG_13750 [Monoraphidium neglectum]|eukprot:XP_013893231.1 hypothetical protein MNEG_13750 [Monoraphidium neglectum]
MSFAHADAAEDVVSALLGAGASIHARDREGRSPMDLACAAGGDPAAAFALYAAGAPPPVGDVGSALAAGFMDLIESNFDEANRLDAIFEARRGRVERLETVLPGLRQLLVSGSTALMAAERREAAAAAAAAAGGGGGSELGVGAAEATAAAVGAGVAQPSV